MIVNKYANGGGGSTSGVTPQDVQQQINSALTPYWDSAITESAITVAVEGKADKKILVNFDKTTQEERAAVYAELKALYDGGSGATINKNYDFYKTVNTWQGQKIDYYTFSGDTLVFGQVVSPENLEDQVAYVQVMEIDSAGNVTVQTNTIGAADMSGYYTSAQTDAAIAQAVSGLATEQYVQDALSGVNMDNYWTSAQTEDAIDEKTAKYFTKDAPIIILSQDNINAFFGEASDIRLLDVTNGYYNDNQFDINSEISGDFIIDKDNKEFYIENVPAGIYRIGVHANNVEDPTLTFKVWIDEEEIETNTTNDLPYAVDDRAAILSIGFDYRYANWSLDADAERITFKYNEENEEFDIEVNYKPTIEEALSAYTPTSGFSTINGSAITNGGNIVIQGGGADMSAYYTSAQTEDAISAATAGKADAANVTANTTMRFPLWNEQGVVTGTTGGPIYKATISYNGQALGGWIKDGNVGVGPFYAPTTPGTAGQILVSAGIGAPVWSAVTFPDVSNYVTSAQVETQIEAKNYVNSGDVKSQVEAYNYATVSQIPTVPTSNTAFTNDAGYITDAAIENLVTSAQVETQITSKGYATVSQIPTVPTSNTAFTNDAGYITSAAIADKVSSTSVSTIWKGTQADYDDIPTKDPNTFYIIL